MLGQLQHVHVVVPRHNVLPALLPKHQPTGQQLHASRLAGRAHLSSTCCTIFSWLPSVVRTKRS
jgi:hypothetical protein